MTVSKPPRNEPAFTRRQALRVGSVGALALLGCGGVSTSSDGGTEASGGGTGSTGGGTGSTGGGTTSTGGGTTSTGGGTTSTGGGTTSTGGGGGTSGALAIGSGAFLVGKDYGNPFASGIGSTCSAYKSATAGPCHSNTFNRKDISDGLVGLPTRLELLIVDTSCTPVPNAIVEIWFASPAGTYSAAQSSADDAGTSYKGSYSDLNVSFCTGNASAALANNWLRGYQTAGSDGRVTFDGIYPGWYASRTTHIHFKITVNGSTYITSQLFADDALNSTIYTTHGSYSSRGNKDTSNASDKVISESGLTLSEVVVSAAQQSDGAMLLWKAITIHS